MSAPGAARKVKDAVKKETQENRLNNSWQPEAFSLAKSVGEIGYVFNLEANLLTKCDVRLMRKDPVNGEVDETKDPRVVRVWDAFVGPRGTQAELIRKAALLDLIAGEGYLIGEPVTDERGNAAGVSWEFLSTRELKLDRGSLKRSQAGMGGWVDVSPDAYVARMLRSDVEFSGLADSTMRRCMSIAREIVLLTQVVDAIAKSRLAAGILYVPWEMSFGPMDESENPGDEAATGIDDFEEELAEHLMAPIEDRASAASLVPLIMRGPAALKDALGTIDVGARLDTLFMELRQEALGRLAAALDVPPEIMQGKGGLNHWCVSDDTEVLTRDRGWVLHGDLHIGDFIRTLNHSSGVAEWGPVLDIYRADVAGEPMVLIEGARHSSLTTPNHRWPSVRGRRGERTWTTSEALDGSDSLVVAAPSGDVPVEAKWSDALVEVAAWLWTKGHVRFRPGRRSPQVTIWQSAKVNADNVARIRSALTVLFGASGPHGHGSAVNPVPGWHEAIRPDRPEMVEFRLNSAAADVVVGLFSDPARKVLDLGFIRDLTAAQLALFIDTSVRADGTVLPSGTIQLAQADADRLAPLELAAVLSGFSTNVYSIPGGMTMLSISRKTLFPLTRKRVEETVYTGTIWCPVTPNRTWLARRNGKAFYTGNTGYNVDADFVQRHVGPLGEHILNFLTEAYLRPMLVTFEDMSPEEANTFFLKLDTTALTARIDSANAVKEAYDRFAIKEESYVRAIGMLPSDIPDPKERRRRLLETMLGGNALRLGRVLLPILYPGDEEIARAVEEWPKFEHEEVVAAAPTEESSTSQGEPTNPEEGTPADPNALIDRLAVAADRELERALEKAGNRLISKIQGMDKQAAERLRRVRRADVLTQAGPDLIAESRLSMDELMREAWDELQVRGRSWVREYYQACGVGAFEADERAESVMRELAGLLTTYAMTAPKQKIRVGANGLKVPHELVELAMKAGELVRS